MVQKIGIAGGGHMGADLFGLFSEKDLDVVLWVRRPEAAAALEEELLGPLRRRAARGGERGAAAERRLARLTITTDLAVLGTCDFVSESIVEDVALKREFFARLGEVAKPEAVFSSNSSYTTPSELAASSGRPDRFIGLHFFFPSRFVPFVEVIPGATTSPETRELTVELVRQIGKRPVMVHKEVPGFLVNRLIAPTTIEGLHIVGEGYFPASQVDVIGRSFLTRGPIETIDQIGVDVILKGELRFPHLKRPGDYMPLLLEPLVAQGRVGQKGGDGVYLYVNGKPVDDPGLPRVFGPGGDPGPYSEEDVKDRLWYCIVIDCYRNLDLGDPEDMEQILKEVIGLEEGPFSFVKRVGLGEVKDRIRSLGAKFGPRFTPPAGMTF